MEALDGVAVRVRRLGGAALGAACERARSACRAARVAYVGSGAHRLARGPGGERYRNAGRALPRVPHRSRLLPDLQASGGPDGLFPSPRGRRHRARGLVAIPAGGLMVDRSSSEFRSFVELYERATLL